MSHQPEAAPQRDSLPASLLNERTQANIEALTTASRLHGRLLSQDPFTQRRETLVAAIDAQVLTMEVDADRHYLQLTRDLPIGQVDVEGTNIVAEILNELRQRLYDYVSYAAEQRLHQQTINLLKERLRQIDEDEGRAPSDEDHHNGDDNTSSDDEDNDDDDNDGQVPEAQAGGGECTGGNFDDPEPGEHNDSTTLTPGSGAQPDMGLLVSPSWPPGSPFEPATSTRNVVPVDSGNPQDEQEDRQRHNEAQNSVQQWVSHVSPQVPPSPPHSIETMSVPPTDSDGIYSSYEASLDGLIDLEDDSEDREVPGRVTSSRRVHVHRTARPSSEILPEWPSGLEEYIRNNGYPRGVLS